MNLKTACILLLLIACTPATAATSLVQLTNDSTFYTLPFWSPDGKSLTFLSLEDDHAGIWLMEHDGQKMRALTDNQSWEFTYFNPWSPDGKSLLFVSFHDGKSDLWTMNPEGSGRVRLTDEGRIAAGCPSPAYGGVWSAEGKEIVYTSCLYDNSAFWDLFIADLAGEIDHSTIANAALEIRGDADLWIMDADGGNKRPLTSGGDASSPQWQPHGDTIAYLSNRSGTHEIWMIDRDGTEDIQVTFTEKHVFEYAWSPDGSAIAYVVARPEADVLEFSIYVIDLKENVTAQLTSGHRDEYSVWSPDGTRIAFSSTTRNPPALWMMKSDGSDLTPLMSGGALHFLSPQWSPDGKQIVFNDMEDLFAIVLDDQQASTTPALSGFVALEVVAVLSLFVFGAALFRRR